MATYEVVQTIQSAREQAYHERHLPKDQEWQQDEWNQLKQTHNSDAAV